MKLCSTLAWLVDAAGASPGADWFLAELGAQLIGDDLPLAGGALTFAVPDPIIARRTWLWRAENGVVIEAVGFASAGFAGAGQHDSYGDAGRRWLAELSGGAVHEDVVGAASDGPVLGWIGPRPFTEAEAGRLREVARIAAAPLAALSARATLTAALEAYLGRRSAARVLAGPLRRDVGETIRAALLYADLRSFTALSEAAPPASVIAALDAWFDCIAGSVHAFGGEVLKFIGDGVLTIFPIIDDKPGNACNAALRAVSSAQAGMAHLDVARREQGLPSLSFGAALHVGEILWGNVGAADRLDFTAIGPAVNLVSRLGLCRPLSRTVLISGALATETTAKLIPPGTHTLRGIATPCAVYTMPDR